MALRELNLDDLKLRTRPDTVNGCWVWAGCKDRDGYGRWDAAESKYGTRAAHRIAFLLSSGFLPEWPNVIDHICKRKDCVNPEHLRILHHLDNAVENFKRDACPKGHHRWRIRTDGSGRECLDCRNIFKKRYRARKKAGLV